VEPEEYCKMYELEDSYWYFVGKRRNAARLLDGYVETTPETRILDVGCGTGAMAKFLAKYGQVTALDISGLALGFCRRRELRELCQASVVALPFEDETFDLVTAFDMINHRSIEDDVNALKEFYRVCKPGGWLLLTDAALNILRSGHDLAYHAVRRYTVPDISRRLGEAGFQVEKASYTDSLLFPVALTVRTVKNLLGDGRVSSDLKPLPPWLNNLCLLTYSFETSLLKLMDLPVGISLACLARRPPGA
jgi:ubiquinone/menaquinone biosynthesis C-methylase UbiE